MKFINRDLSLVYQILFQDSQDSFHKRSNVQQNPDANRGLRSSRARKPAHE